MKNMKNKWIAITVALLVATNVITFVITSSVTFSIPNGKVSMSRKDYDDYTKFGKLFTVKDKLYANYDGKIDDNTLLEGAIKGMTNSLNDPYTVYMNKQEYTAFNTSTTGTYAGVGTQVEAKEDQIVITTVFDGSPAKKGGILSGDIIEKIDGKDVSGKDLDGAANMMRGPEGTQVTITILRGTKAPFDVKLTRAKITLNTVTYNVLDNNIGYIMISMFDENTSANFNKALKSLNDQHVKGIILDLRDNPGGLLGESVKVVSNFITKGKVVVSTIDKYNKKEVLNSVGGSNIGMPLVVLVNGNTASASEIVSGAIRDYKVGTLVGEKTFGKGIVQTVFDDSYLGFNDGTALKVTTAKYYTPSGENIHKKGISPDVEVAYPVDSKQTYSQSTDPQFQKALEIIKQKIGK